MPFFTQFFIISADYSFCKFFLVTLPGVYQYVGALTRPVTYCTPNRRLCSVESGIWLTRPVMHSASRNLPPILLSPGFKIPLLHIVVAFKIDIV